MSRALVSAGLLCGWLGALGCAAPGGLAVATDPSPSQWVEVVSRSVSVSTSPQAEGAWDVTLALRNRSGRDVWVTAAFDAPEAAPGCLAANALAPGEMAAFTCVQPSVPAGAAYRVQIQVFDVEGPPLGTSDVTLSFSAAEIAAARERKGEEAFRAKPVSTP